MGNPILEGRDPLEGPEGHEKKVVESNFQCEMFLEGGYTNFMDAKPPSLPLPGPVAITTKPSLAGLLADFDDGGDDTSMTVDRCASCGVDPDQPHRWGCNLHGSQQVLVRR